MTQYPNDDAGTTSFGSAADRGEPVETGTEATWPPHHADDTSEEPSTTQYSTTQSSTAQSSTDQSSTKDAAKNEAGAVKDTAAKAGNDVATTAKDEAQNVVGEAKDQALGLLDQAKSEAGSQVGTQQQRIAGLLGGYASELQSMTSGEESSGPVTDLARQGADKASELTSWLESHEPADVLDEVRAFARRRPVAFLIGAALAGVVVGRATRGFASNAKAEKVASSPATPVRAELPGTSTAPSRSLVEEVPTQADAFGQADALGQGGDPAAPYDSAEPVVSPVFDDDQRRDDVVR